MVVVVVVVRSVVRQVSELHRCSVCARDTNLILETQPTHCPLQGFFSLTSQGAICKAVSTRGQSRPLAFESVWLRVRMLTTEKPLKHNKGTQYKHVKKLTSPAPAISTRSHPCTASHPESDELTRAKTQIRIFQSSSLLKRHPIARQLDEGKTHKCGSSNHYRC